MKRIFSIGAAVVFAAFGAFAGDGGAEAALKSKLPEIFAKAAEHYRALDQEASRLMKGKVVNKARSKSDLYSPHGWDAKTGKLDMRSVFWWTSGHFPGSLWYLYEATGDESLKKRALAWTENLAPNSKVNDNHDVGFIMNCSFGNARRLLKTDGYDRLLIETASSLSERFNKRLGLIRSWGAISDEKNFLVIPDNMMNLELLELASKLPGGDRRFDEIARSHADVTMAHQFRADGGVRHVLNYDMRTKRVKEIRRGQGASCETAWARGQAWAIYGYSMMFRETGERRYFDFACKLADYAIDHPNMPEDGVPYWDFGAPGEERDSSAAAVMASGLIELGGFAGGEKGAKYRAFAVKQLTTLSSPEYFSKGGEIGHFLLKHGVGHKPANSEIDTPLDYGDYYYLEALLRLSMTSQQKQDSAKSVRYRGMFINDEFYGLRPWAIRNFGLREHIGTNAYKEVFSLMKREGLNLLWPAMHPCGAYPAYEYSKRPENLEQAAKYGITIGTSHCEPMLRNNAILSAKDKKKWNWTRHRKWLEEYWREGARRGAGKNILWTIGMRGISDSGLPDGKTLKDKVRILEDVFATQCAMLPKDAPKVFIPYKEAMNIYNAGLKVPDGATIMWANDNFGYVRRLGGPQAEGHGGGIYWHISYWGDPHSYYHVCTTPPAFMWYELVAKCWNNGVRDVWMVNAGDVFQAELMLKAYGKFANDPDAWGPDAQPRFLSGWAEEFLSGAAEIDAGTRQTLSRRIAEHLAEYYNLGFNRKPEHMCIQWTKNLPPDVKSGLLKRYHAFLAEEDAIEAALPASLREAYFRVVGYQARFLAHAGIIHLEGKGKKYAHDVIDPLTARWNAMEGGKWAGIWCDTIDGIDMLYKRNYNHSASIMQWPWNEPKDSKKKAARAKYPATQYRADVPEPEWLVPVANKPAGGGAWTRVAGLGTSGNALALLPVKPGVGEGAKIEYALTGNEKTIVFQFLPDFALWPGLKLGVNASFDGAEPRYVAVPESDSNIGEKNRLRNKAVQDNFIRVEIPVPEGAKKLEIIATDPGVVIDRVGARAKPGDSASED